MAVVLSKPIFGRLYSNDTLTTGWVAPPAPNVSEPNRQVKIGNEVYNYNGLTVTWPNH